jgi:hypothetical protein
VLIVLEDWLAICMSSGVRLFLWLGCLSPQMPEEPHQGIGFTVNGELRQCSATNAFVNDSQSAGEGNRGIQGVLWIQTQIFRQDAFELRLRVNAALGCQSVILLNRPASGKSGAQVFERNRSEELFEATPTPGLVAVYGYPRPAVCRIVTLTIRGNMEVNPSSEFVAERRSHFHTKF